MVKEISKSFGEWAEVTFEIDSTFISYFESICTSSNPSLEGISSIRQFIPFKVTSSINSKLLAPFTKKDIEIAL